MTVTAVLAALVFVLAAPTSAFAWYSHYAKVHVYDVQSDLSVKVSNDLTEGGSGVWVKQRYWTQSYWGNQQNWSSYGIYNFTPWEDAGSGTFTFDRYFGARNTVGWDYKVKPGYNAWNNGNGSFHFKGDNWAGQYWSEGFTTYYVLPPKAHVIGRYSSYANSVTGATSPQTNGRIDMWGDRPAIVWSTWNFMGEMNVWGDFWLDRIAPQTTASITPPTCQHDWRNAASTVTLTATDPKSANGITDYDVSRVNRISAKLAGVALADVAGTSRNIALGEGRHTVEYWAVDNDGNVEQHKSVTARIDLRAPTSSAEVLGGMTKVVSLTASDPRLVDGADGSGVAGIEYRLNGSDWQIYTAPFVATGVGCATVDFRARDLACNVEAAQTLVIPLNDPPAAEDGSAATDEETPVEVTLVGSDIDGDELSYVIVDQPLHGSIEQTGNVAIYTPEPDYSGPDSFRFKVNDGQLDSNLATVSIMVNPVNDAPVAEDGTAETDEDASVQIPLKGSDLDGDDLSYTLIDQPLHGSIEQTGNVVIYTPAPDYSGTDYFTFKVNDGALDSNTATVSITVNPINDAPLAEDGTAETDEDTPIDIILVGSDVDGDDLSYVVVEQPLHGSIEQTGNVVAYTPEPDYSGPDSFKFFVNDGAVDSNVATISITVNPVNDAPVAEDGTAETDEDTPIDIVLVGSDTDGDTLTYDIVDQPVHGSIEQIGNVVVYTPDADYDGPDSFTYKVNDGQLDSNLATVVITVRPVNDAPAAADLTAETDEETSVEVTLLGSDIDGDELGYIIVDAPLHGGVVLDGDKVTYTPDADYDGPDSFTYKVNDGQLDSNIATVAITVRPVNDAPVAADLTAETDEDTSVEVTLLGSDIDGDTITYEIVDKPLHGSIEQTGNVVVYTPDADYNGPDSFTYKVNDGQLDSNIATVAITVRPVNDAPWIHSVPDVVVDEGSLATNSGLIGDIDSSMTVECSMGSVEFDGEGWEWAYGTTDGPAESRPVTITVTDAEGSSASTVFRLDVRNVAPNPGPITSSVAPVPLGATVPASAPFTDPGTGDTHTATWDWGDGTQSVGNVVEANGSGTVDGSHAYTSSGVYLLKLQVTDDDGGSGWCEYRYVVVYDNRGGFVTGGGWIDTPVGSYNPQPSLGGRASFGFVAKYQKGASTPSGNTEFQFHAAGMNFKATAYDWLVVSGTKATYKGTGTINGAGSYKFMLTATDRTPDTFRMKIVDAATSAVVYDNQAGVADDADPATALSGGNIVIHK